jgi:DNA-binding MarR family transcriptional regulator
MFKKLDPLLHNELRLAVIAYLIAKQKVSFKELKGVTNATSGNLSIQLKKLEQVKYISIHKSFKDNYPLTLLKSILMP